MKHETSCPLDAVCTCAATVVLSVTLISGVYKLAMLSCFTMLLSSCYGPFPLYSDVVYVNAWIHLMS